MSDFSPSPASPQKIGRLKTVGLIAAVLAILVALGGVVARVRAGQALKSWTEAQTVRTVTLAKLKGGGKSKLVIPGEVQAFYTAPIYARASGYLKRWYADIGQPVKAGQLLAEIDTPELDQQVLQARADLATAQANRNLSEITAKRWTALVAQDAVSRQEADEKMGDLAARTSVVNASRANLDRLLATAQFKRVVSPFDGVVTIRNTDIGALITAGGGQPLYTVADQHRLRIFVRLPQGNSAKVHKGMIAEVVVPEYPGETFKAAVVNLGQSVAAQSGSVLVELQLDNAAGRLKSGEYAQASFDLPSAEQTVVVPATAMMFLSGKPTVAVLDASNHVRFRPVGIARDYGVTIGVGSGVTAQDRVIDNPPEALTDGELVKLAPKGGVDAKG